MSGALVKATGRLVAARDRPVRAYTHRTHTYNYTRTHVQSYAHTRVKSRTRTQNRRACVCAYKAREKVTVYAARTAAAVLNGVAAAAGQTHTNIAAAFHSVWYGRFFKRRWPAAVGVRTHTRMHLPRGVPVHAGSPRRRTGGRAGP